MTPENALKKSGEPWITSEHAWITHDIAMKNSGVPWMTSENALNNFWPNTHTLPTMVWQNNKNMTTCTICNILSYIQNYCSTERTNVTRGQIAHNLETEHLLENQNVGNHFSCSLPSPHANSVSGISSFLCVVVFLYRVFVCRILTVNKKNDSPLMLQKCTDGNNHLIKNLLSQFQ